VETLWYAIQWKKLEDLRSTETKEERQFPLMEPCLRRVESCPVV